jgi:hypothetical protein
MRRYALLFLIGALSLQMSCYIVNTEKSSQVTLARTFPNGVTALHAAVFEGAATEDNLLSYQVFRSGQTATLSVPAGPSRVFVIWGEGSTAGIATYYGAAGPVDVESDGDMQVPVTMQAINTALLNVAYNSNAGIVTWNSLLGGASYELQNRPATGGNWTTVYSGANTTFDSFLGGSWRVRVVSTIFNLTTGYY